MKAKGSGSFLGAKDELSSDRRERQIHLGRRGRTWGFRFLRTGGLTDPLGEYERAFSKIGDEPEDWGRVDDKVALRFLDPKKRQDAAGRVIPHEFVLVGHWADAINSLEDGRRLIWKRIADGYEDAYERTEPPPVPG